MGNWLEDVWNIYQCCRDDIEEGQEYMDPSILPGWAYTRALILREKEKMKCDRGEVGSTRILMFVLILASGHR